MKTDTITAISLEQTLENLKAKATTFNQAAEELFSYSFNDFNLLFELDRLQVEPENYVRIPVLRGENFAAILMIWGVDNHTAIHDHQNYDGIIKVLKGSLTEVSFRENSNFIEFDGTGTAHKDQVFPEEKGGIHSIANISDDVSVSLHLYRTPQLNLDGVRIFDTVKRRIGWLNQHATSCSWKLPRKSYSKIVNI